MKYLFVSLAIILTSSLTSRSVGAADFDYPELMVTPRASERLKMEAASEPKGMSSWFWQIQLPAAAATVAGLMGYSGRNQFADPIGAIPLIQMGTGAFWVVFSTVLSMTTHPYNAGWEDIKNLPTNSKRDQLSKERLAEEVLMRAARTQLWLGIAFSATSVVTNVFAGQSSSNSAIGSALSFVAAGLSLMPLIFPSHPRGIWSQHQEYKKKIYGPIASRPFAINPGTGAIAPGVSLAFIF